ncbi:MAG: restriction endonuclease [Bacteroidota bacterium]|jgi:restriction system protein|nr:restriction endonuclease [Bacteroidota bacterium]
MKGPQFLIYINPVVKTLKDMGGAGVTSEVIDSVIEKLKIPESEVEQTIPSGQSRVKNRIQWARMYLTKAGYIDSKVRGTWKLTDKGLGSNLSEKDVMELYKTVQASFSVKNSTVKKTSPENKIMEEEYSTEEEEHSYNLLSVIQSLSPDGFERICKRLLTECGFQNVQVTGKSGDNGIDGIGLLEINDLVSFKVLFQCKRYKESVGPGQVRDFRGAMQGRADKGIILTTGRFTKEARNEAIRDGVPPIELVDGEKLVDLFEKFELGLKPKTVYDIDSAFFEEFK